MHGNTGMHLNINARNELMHYVQGTSHMHMLTLPTHLSEIIEVPGMKIGVV